MIGADDWFTLEELTARLGALTWVEQRLADLYGAWSQLDADDAVAVAFSAIAKHHRWHADIVRSCLATSPDLGADAAVAAPTEGWQSSLDALAGLADPDDTETRLASIVKVVDPWLTREVGALRELARPVSDAPMARWLRFVAIDHDDDHDVLAELLHERSTSTIEFEAHHFAAELDLGET